MNNVGLISVLVAWVGLFFLIWKWKGNLDLTFSQNAARERSSRIFYTVLWLFVLPMFFWFLMVPFASELQLGLVYKILVVTATLGMLVAALVPEIEGWKKPVHRFAAYTMAYTMLPVVMLIAASGQISFFARAVTSFISIVLFIGLVISIKEKRQHKHMLVSQGSYIALFHLAILLAYYL
jgi:hypothetical protein